MPKFRTPITSATALANGNAIAAIVPAAAVNFKVLQVFLGVVNAGGAITDYQVAVGVNRATARGTATTTLTATRSDPNSGPSVITGIDSAWSVQPTLAAQDLDIYPFNTRGGQIFTFSADDLMGTVGTANPLVFVNRSGAALPTAHAVVLTLATFE